MAIDAYNLIRAIPPNAPTAAKTRQAFFYGDLLQGSGGVEPAGKSPDTAEIGGQTGRRSQIADIKSSTASGVNLAYTCDELGRLANVLANTNQAAGYGYDEVGNLQSMRYGDGVTNLYQYDSRNRLADLVWQSGSTPLASFGYALGATGNRATLVETVKLAAGGAPGNRGNAGATTGESRLGGAGVVGKGIVRARQLRVETPMTLRWIAERLHMGSWTCVANLLQE